MKTNIVVAILVVALGVLTVTVVRQYRELTELKKSLQISEAKVAAATKPAIVRPIPVDRPPKPRAERTVAAEIAAVASSEAVTNAPAQKPANFLASIGSMAKDPAMRGMMRSQQKMSFDMLYGGLFKELSLSTEQLDAFKELLLDRQMAMMDVSLGMMGGQMSATDRIQKGKELEEIKSSHDKKIEEFLGAEGYGVFKDYEQTQAERMQVNLFKHSLASADGLTEQQESDLVRALYDERKRFPESAFMRNTAPAPGEFTEEMMTEQMKQLEQMQVKYLERATAILTPTQLEQFKKSQEQQRAMMQMGMKMASQMFGQQKTAPPKP